MTFLGPNATRGQRLRAVAANHTEWFIANARASGGEVCREDGATRVYTPGLDGGEVVIAFPRIPETRQGVVLDSILGYCRERGVRKASCWAQTPRGPRGLGARLAARGFEWGWQAHWMGWDLTKLPDDVPVPDGLRIAPDDACDWDVKDLPYFDWEGAAVVRAQARAEPRRIWHFGAWLGGNVVGQVRLHVTTGRLGVAGIYALGVVPAARRQGVGRALMLEACRFARSLGCNHALLNSAASDFYYRLGWEGLGHGQTWWMHPPVLAAPPPPPEQVAFAEAVGLGDTEALGDLQRRGALPADLNAPLAAGHPPMTLAIQARKPSSVRWLEAHGATLDLLQAWDLGWRKRAARMLADSPERANRRSGPMGITLLHEAVSRGDVDLARLLLTADPDLSIEDTEFHSTPLGWARHFGRTEFAALLERHLSDVRHERIGS